MEKLVVAQGTVFLGSVESTFTKDIMEMRHRMGTWALADSLLCLGQKEWEEEHADVPKWMVEAKRVRRWKTRYGRVPGMKWEVRKRRLDIIKVMEWLEWASWKKGGVAKLPKWLVKHERWHKWKVEYPREEGISEKERGEREWIVSHYVSMEYAITHGLGNATTSTQ
jgi:hypothetical protein